MNQIFLLTATFLTVYKIQVAVRVFPGSVGCPSRAGENPHCPPSQKSGDSTAPAVITRTLSNQDNITENNRK